MSVIDADASVVTVINVFTVAPQDQQRLLDLLVEATTTVISAMPGFVSANFHASLDGTKVANYAQWRSVEDVEAMRAHPDSQQHFADARAIATPAFGLYRVSHVASAPAPQPTTA